MKSSAQNKILFFLKKKQQNDRKKENFRQGHLPKKTKKAEILRTKKISAFLILQDLFGLFSLEDSRRSSPSGIC